MIARTLLILLACQLWRCSTLEAEEPDLPSLSGLSPQNIVTAHNIVNIVVDQGEFDRMYARHKEDILVNATIDIYKTDKSLATSGEPAIIEIKGAGSTNNALKSIGITFGNKICNDGILDPLILQPGHSLDSLWSIRVRNSGSDFYGTMFKDMAYGQMLMEAGIRMELMYGTPSHVFVNSTYLGLMNIRTETNIQALAALLEIDTMGITLMDVDTDNQNLEYRDGDMALAKKLQRAFKKEPDVNVLWEMIDIDNFIDYIIFEDYIGNNDWPGNNVKAYSVNGSPFRFILFDLDRASDRPRVHEIPQLEYLNYDIARIYQTLAQNPDFLPRLEARQKEIFGLLEPSNFNRIVDQFAARIDSDMDYQIAKYATPPSKFEWYLNIESIKRNMELRDKRARKKYDLEK